MSEKPQQKFDRLASQWKMERPYGSNIGDMCSTPAYLAVIGMGRDALGPILERLRVEPEHWFVALHAITEPMESPVPKEDWGRVKKMAEHWVAWGVREGIIK